MSTIEAVDVLVAGAGNAALTAAIAAHDAGAQVAVFESASEELRGGNTRFSGAIFRCVYRGIDELQQLIGESDDPSDVELDPYVRDDYLADFARLCEGKSDAVLTELLVDKSYETVKWMAGLGVEWEYNRVVGSHAIPGTNRTKLGHGNALRVKGEGVALSASLFKAAEQRGIAILYDTSLKRIVRNPGGEVDAVEVDTAEGPATIGCKALVLATGGFQANRQLRSEHLGDQWGGVVVRGSRFDTGAGLVAALEVGAAATGDWGGCHATPVAADAPELGDLRLTDKTNRMSFPLSVMLNLDGRRFVDEGSDFTTFTYAKMGRAVLQEPEGIAFQIYDSQTQPYLEPRYSGTTPVTATTLSELAAGIKERYPAFDAETGLKVMEEYNAATGGGEVDPTRRDGMRTNGVTPDKTNWAVRLDQPPYVAYPVRAGITFTFGGIRINTSAEVLDEQGAAIPGFYATGELTGGFFFGNYPGGAGLTRGAVFGRIAGEQAAGRAASAA